MYSPANEALTNRIICRPEPIVDTINTRINMFLKRLTSTYDFDIYNREQAEEILKKEMKAAGDLLNLSARTFIWPIEREQIEKYMCDIDNIIQLIDWIRTGKALQVI